MSGQAWTSEYGDPRIPEDFDFMYPLSPVHNVPTGKVLPATLLMINAGEGFSQVQILSIPDVRLSSGDDRVVPMHSFKFVAALQHSVPQNPHPLLIHIDKSWLGHGNGKPADKQ